MLLGIFSEYLTCLKLFHNRIVYFKKVCIKPRGIRQYLRLHKALFVSEVYLYKNRLEEKSRRALEFCQERKHFKTDKSAKGMLFAVMQGLTTKDKFCQTLAERREICQILAEKYYITKRFIFSSTYFLKYIFCL